jgi:hypothetical protein
MKTTTQKNRLREFLDSGRSVTRLSAFNELGIVELSARICNLEREGYSVSKERIKVVNRFNETVTVMKYKKK